MEKKLSELKYGEKGTIKIIPKNLISHVTGMGIRVNKTVKISSKQPLNGPVTFTIGNNSISLGRTLAEQIIIEV